MKKRDRGLAGAFGGIGCTFIVIVGAIYGLTQCTKDEPPTAAEMAAEEAKIAEDTRKGFHCLSGWDGSHADLVTRVKVGLRNPGSFEHVDTLITPVNSKTGKHGVSMTFRSENGFGGTNVGRAVGEVDPVSCHVSNVVVDG